ncbi:MULTISPECIES: hypothetical protein [unclassified Knoellia]|uniref:hypothetical protein n=1 Tax=Knoellia altitudinis TaxID=3404795 RepID=UPI00360D05FC
MSSFRTRGVAFTVLVAVVVGVTVVYLLVAARSRGDLAAATLPSTSPATTGRSDLEDPDGYIAFRRTTNDAAYGTVGTVPYDEPGALPAPRQHLSCERIHLSRRGGVCIDVDRAAVTTARVLLLEPDLTVRHTLSTPGIPSRARVSPDGRWAATTTFVFGHSYAGGRFSTQTEIYDMVSGTSSGSLEKFQISHRGKPYRASDVNVWGVTFPATGSSFYATIMTGGKKYLAKGLIDQRTIVMVDVAAECPSLSPSGELLAYKSATGPTTWEVKVRRLADGSEVVVETSRSVDDQIEWLDDGRVLFGLAPPGGGATADVWVAPADGSRPAELLIRGAWSPAVVR